MGVGGGGPVGVGVGVGGALVEGIPTGGITNNTIRRVNNEITARAIMTGPPVPRKNVKIVRPAANPVRIKILLLVRPKGHPSIFGALIPLEDPLACRLS